MTKEQEAIENLENLSEYGLCYTINEKIQEDIETVLNMLKEKDAEIEKYKQLYNKALDDAVITAHDNMKKDKIIDLMAEQLIGLPVNKIKQDFEKPNFKAEITIFTDKEAIKQYFERKVKQSSDINITSEEN